MSNYNTRIVTDDQPCAICGDVRLLGPAFLAPGFILCYNPDCGKFICADCVQKLKKSPDDPTIYCPVCLRLLTDFR
jgi:hypothetical protein